MAEYLDIEGRSVPQPQYKGNATKLVDEYKRAMRDIQSYLLRIDLNNFQRANALVTLKQIEKRLKELDLFAADWVKASIPEAAFDGTAATLVNLGLAATLVEAKDIVKFNQLNTAMIELYIERTNEDILAITNNIRKQVRNTIREVSGEVMRQQMAKGVNGIETQNRLILQGLRDKLGDSVEKVILDAGKNRWNPSDYVDMLTRSVQLETYRQAQTNEAVARGANYGIISYAGAKDACRFHEGRIIKLVPQAEGSYPTYDELKASNQIFHPRCRHHFTVFKNFDRLSDSVRESAEKQHERGNAALAAGGRNPKDIE